MCLTSTPYSRQTGTNSNEEVLFNREVAFPNLEKLTISHLTNLKWIWSDQLHEDSFQKLKELEVEYCHELLNVFPSFVLRVFQSLEILRATDCDSLEQVFDMEETSIATMQLRQLYLHRLPKLKHVWNMGDLHPNTISFQNLQAVEVWECRDLKSLFPSSIAKCLPQLESLGLYSSGVEEILSKNNEGLKQETQFEFDRLSFLGLSNLPALKCFYPGIHTSKWPSLKTLRTYKCEKIQIFGQVGSQLPYPLFLIDKIIPQLEEVSFRSDDISTICNGNYAADLFSRIKVLRITCFHNESTVFPFQFLQRFYSLETLVLLYCDFGESSLHRGDAGEETVDFLRLPKVKYLKLQLLPNITRQWKEDSPLHHICASLETLEVWKCHSLVNLASSSASFQNLTTLDVYQCNGMVELITSSKAQSLMCLVTMRIRECEMMAQVVLARDEVANEIDFRQLKTLELHCLPSLKSFCSAGQFTFNFPSLQQVIVSQCPSLKSFCQGELITPKLQTVQLKKTDSECHWAGDLNATVEQLYMEQNGVQLLENEN